MAGVVCVYIFYHRSYLISLTISQEYELLCVNVWWYFAERLLRYGPKKKIIRLYLSGQGHCSRSKLFSIRHAHGDSLYVCKVSKQSDGSFWRNRENKTRQNLWLTMTILILDHLKSQVTLREGCSRCRNVPTMKARKAVETLDRTCIWYWCCKEQSLHCPQNDTEI